MKLFRLIFKFGQILTVLSLSSAIKYLILRLTNHRGIRTIKTKVFGKVYLRFGSTDVHVFDQILIQGEFNTVNLDKVETIIDAGSNIGLSTIYFNQKYSNAKIFSIEPEKGNLEILKLNLSNLKDILIIDKALWSHNKRLSINDRGTGHWGFKVTENNQEIKEELIDGISVENLMKQYNVKMIDVFKMDIEGSEREIFSMNFDYWLPRTRLLLVEVHDYINPEASKAVFRAILKYNFSLEIMGEYLVFRNNELL